MTHYYYHYHMIKLLRSAHTGATSHVDQAPLCELVMPPPPYLWGLNFQVTGKTGLNSPD